MLVKLDSFPKVRGKNNKYLKPPPSLFFGMRQFQHFGGKSSPQTEEGGHGQPWALYVGSDSRFSGGPEIFCSMAIGVGQQTLGLLIDLVFRLVVSGKPKVGSCGFFAYGKYLEDHPVSKWLTTMVSKSPKWGYSPYKWPKYAQMAYKWRLLTTY